MQSIAINARMQCGKRIAPLVKRKFTFVHVEPDWQAIYMDDTLLAEGHSISAHDLLDGLADVLPNIVEHTRDLEYDDDCACIMPGQLRGMPKTLTELKAKIG